MSVLNEARLNTEEIIDELHGIGAFGSKKPRTYRQVAKNQYNGFSKARKKSKKMIRKAMRQQLGYLRRNLKMIHATDKKLREELSAKLQERLSVVEVLYAQQKEMFEKGTHRIDERIVSLSQPWVRPIVRGKQNAPVEFGAKVEMRVVNGYLRIERICDGMLSTKAPRCRHLLNPIEDALVTILRVYWQTRFFGREKTSDTARSAISTSADHVLGKGQSICRYTMNSFMRSGSNPESAEKLNGSLE